MEFLSIQFLGCLSAHFIKIDPANQVDSSS